MATTAPQTTGVNVRVKQTPGGPRIHVDGKPILPHFFAGFLGGSLRTDSEWRDVSFEFALPRNDADSAAGIIRIRFNTACDFLLKDIRVVDCENGADVLPADSFAGEGAFATVWDALKDEKPKKVEPDVSYGWTADGIRVELTGEVSGWWPTFRFENRPGTLDLQPGRRYRCELRTWSSERALVNVTVMKQDGAGRRAPIGEPVSDLFASQFRMAREAGIRLCHVQMPTCFGPPEEEQDWEPLDRYFQRVIDIVSDALIVPRIEADAPAWWRERHPEDVMVYESGSDTAEASAGRADRPETVLAQQHGRVGHKNSVSSRDYRRDMAAHFEKLCRHLCEKYPDNFAGILPLGQGTYEWYYEGSQGLLLSGYNKPVQDAWRSWLVERGWDDAESATVPSPERRHGAPNGVLRDPASEAELIEFARFRQAEMADTILELGAACRRGTNNTKLTMFFYGYLFEFGMMRNGVYDSGHYALSRILEHDDVDILCAPLSYTDRSIGGSLPCMTVAESIHAAGILWLNEDDCRTHFAGTTTLGGVSTPEESIQILRRSRGQAFIRGFSDWWLDIRDMGWHDDPEMWQIQQQLNAVAGERLASNTPYTPDVLAVMDEDSMMLLSGQSVDFARSLVYTSRAAFGRIGAPYGQVRLDDVASGRFQGQLQVFLTAWAPTNRQRELLQKNHGTGITRVWCHAPGIARADGFSMDGVTDMTSFCVEPVKLGTAVATPTEAGRDVGLTDAWGPAIQVNPLFSVVPEPGDAVWATFSDGSAAVVVRSSQNGNDVFVAVPAFTPELLRALARVAGVHLYTEVDAAVWAHENMVCLHTMSDAPLTVTMPGGGTVTDVFTGRSFGEGPTVTIPARKGDTLLLKSV